MNKAYILSICMLGASFTGCVEDEEDKPSDLENAFKIFAKLYGFVIDIHERFKIIPRVIIITVDIANIEIPYL